jgi:threonine dehydrogenase-like Zn-dependent dehydrogenase
MSDPSMDLDELRSVWRDTVGPDAASLQQLRRDAVSQTRRLYAAVALECMGTAAAIVLFVWLAGDAATAAGRLAYLGVGVLALTVQVWMIWLRRKVLRARAAAPRDYLVLQAQRSRVAVRLAWLALVGGPVGVAIGLVLGRWAPSKGIAVAVDVGGRGAIGLLVLGFVAMLAYAAWVVRRERRRLAATERALGELE